ncbi:MAG TPA: alpha/beta fold hydrolase [Elusimicrobiota bacterium]|jgi:dienelactone hydrolase|nr:alpha/beta fold hydrolase [Elusimicrobiota bacterium]
MRIAALLAGALASAAAAAPAPYRAPTLAGTPLEFKTADGWTIHAVWQKARDGKPTVILLHGTGQRKEDWRPFARALSRAGDGYAALDLRGHGESRVSPAGETLSYRKLRVSARGANDYEDMTRDVEAAVAALIAQGVPEESLGVMGAEVGGSVAIKYAAVHPKVPFVIMLSPGLDTEEIPIVNAMRAFKGRTTPILLVHSEADKHSSRDTPLLYAFAKNSVGERNATLIVVPDERGTRMLRVNKGLTERIVDWIANPVQPEAPAVSTAAAPGVSTEAASGVSADTSTASPAEAAPDPSGAPDSAPQPDPAPAPSGSGDGL